MYQYMYGKTQPPSTPCACAMIVCMYAKKKAAENLSMRRAKKMSCQKGNNNRISSLNQDEAQGEAITRDDPPLPHWHCPGHRD